MINAWGFQMDAYTYTPTALVSAITDAEKVSQAIDAVKALIGTGADVNEADSDGTTPLMYAAWQGEVELLRVLVDAGAKVDETSIYERLGALGCAVQNGHINAVKYLISEAGANKDITTADGMTLLMSAATFRTNPEGTEPLPGSAAIVKYLIQEEKVDIYRVDGRNKTVIEQILDSSQMMTPLGDNHNKAEIERQRKLCNENCVFNILSALSADELNHFGNISASNKQLVEKFNVALNENKQKLNQIIDKMFIPFIGKVIDQNNPFTLLPNELAGHILAMQLDVSGVEIPDWYRLRIVGDKSLKGDLGMVLSSYVSKEINEKENSIESQRKLFLPKKETKEPEDTAKHNVNTTPERKQIKIEVKK